jgi:selenide,water dikinase
MNEAISHTAIKLTAFSHGGGCGCKIAPALLREMLAGAPLSAACDDLLVGTESADDAAVYRLNDSQAVIATTDFFTPIVDDPFDFGRIAATNALSDIYAMGGKPILALAIVGMPVNSLPLDVIRKILAGGEAVCESAGIPIAGGHSIDTPEPIYGLAALGLARPDEVKRNDRAQAEDILILGKALGVGILSAALKKSVLDAGGYEEMIATTTQLNTPGADLAKMTYVHAMTDVTGFGLIGHLLGMCRASGVAAEIDWERLPILPSALSLAQQGLVTGASARNWASFEPEVKLPPAILPWQKNVLTDPQTSGGLLVACAPEAARDVMAIFGKQGFGYAAEIGRLKSAAAKVEVR